MFIFYLYFLILVGFFLLKHIWRSLKAPPVIFSREIMFLKSILQSFKLFLSLLNLKWALSWFCELAPMSLGLFSPFFVALLKKLVTGTCMLFVS